jgi:hypothetical protein
MQPRPAIGLWLSRRQLSGAREDSTLRCSPHPYIWPSDLGLLEQLTGFELEARHANWAGRVNWRVPVYRLPAAS